MKLSRYITVLYVDSGLKICNYCLFLRKQGISVYPKDCMDYPLLSTTFKFILCSERKKSSVMYRSFMPPILWEIWFYVTI